MRLAGEAMSLQEDGVSPFCNGSISMKQIGYDLPSQLDEHSFEGKVSVPPGDRADSGKVNLSRQHQRYRSKRCLQPPRIFIESMARLYKDHAKNTNQALLVNAWKTDPRFELDQRRNIYISSACRPFIVSHSPSYPVQKIPMQVI